MKTNMNNAMTTEINKRDDLTLACVFTAFTVCPAKLALKRIERSYQIQTKGLTSTSLEIWVEKKAFLSVQGNNKIARLINRSGYTGQLYLYNTDAQFGYSTPTFRELIYPAPNPPSEQ